ncbi:hypothetical protein LCGC14_1298590, partial [marine sediment metagenome]
MIKITLLRVSQLNDFVLNNKQRVVLVFLFSSWLLYPFRGFIFLQPELKYLIYLLLPIFTYAVLLEKHLSHDGKKLMPPSNLVVLTGFFYLIYVSCLGFASFSAVESSSIDYYIKFLAKLFCLVLFALTMDIDLLKAGFRLYSNLVVTLVSVAILVMIGVGLFFLEPVAVIVTNAVGGYEVGLPFYGLSFYGQAPLPSESLPLARLQ